MIIACALTGCVTWQSTLLKGRLVYETEAKANYQIVGKCIKATFPPTKFERRISQPILYNRKVIDIVDIDQTYGVEANEDQEKQHYYINDITQTGLSNNKRWIIIVENNNKANDQSRIQVKTRSYLLREAPKAIPFPVEKHIEPCLFRTNKQK
jgi:hypothetical protein